MITVDKFDLNIEKILENWELHHALRELLSNAIDEQILTDTTEVEVFKIGKAWCIRDYGRGIRYVHLTQNENDEKLKSPNVIGKFGIGLKDALATFDRHGVQVTLKSKFSIISTEMLPKDRFADILTLHAMIQPAIDKDFVGTEVIISGISDHDMETAKKLFLKFSDDEILETTRFGQIVGKNEKVASIYINGVKVAEEPNFLFSYNITHRNAAIRKSLNRERNNVGRTAYADIVKKIILSSKSKDVAKFLADDIQRVTTGLHSDELSWLDVQEHAVKLLNATGNYLFLSADQIQAYPSMIEEANSTGCRLIVIPQELKYRISGNTDMSGNPIRDIDQFMTEYNDSFIFDFVDVTKLSAKEKLVFNYTDNILDLIGGKPKEVKHIKVSSTMRKSLVNVNHTSGLWDLSTKSIIIHRATLKSLIDFAGTLIHEAIHARDGLDDMSRDFENQLTEAIGIICNYALRNDKPKGKFK